MASVLNNKANIVLFHKVESFDDVLGVRYIYRVLYVRADGTWGLNASKWITALVERNGVHDRRRVFFALGAIQWSYAIFKKDNELERCSMPALLNLRTLCSIIQSLVTHAGEGDRFDQPAVERLIERVPYGDVRPGRIGRQYSTVGSKKSGVNDGTEREPHSSITNEGRVG